LKNDGDGRLGMKLPAFGIDGSNFLSASPLPENDLRFEAIASRITARVSSGRIVEIVFGAAVNGSGTVDIFASPTLSVPATCGRSGKVVGNAADTRTGDPSLVGVPVVGITSSSLSNKPPPSKSSIAADFSAAGVFADARCMAAALIATPITLSASSSVRSCTSMPSSSSESASSDCFGVRRSGAAGPVWMGAYCTVFAFDVFGWSATAAGVSLGSTIALHIFRAERFGETRDWRGGLEKRCYARKTRRSCHG
jgi:hypothetical protein